MAISPSTTLSVSDRIYRALLAAYPKKFHEEYGPHMAQVFRDCCRDAQRQHGTPGVVGLWLPTLGDLAATALAERISERRHWDMSSPKLVFWGGLASTVGGVLWALGFFSIWPLLPIALLLWLGGLVGLHARQARRAGWLGWAGLLLALIGNALAFVSFSYGLYRSPASTTIEVFLFLGFGILCAGLVLLGLVTLRAKELPRWRALPLILGLLCGILVLWFLINLPQALDQKPHPELLTQFFVIGVLMGAGWAGLGLTLMADIGEVTAQPPLASA